MAKGLARPFGQDLMRGEHQIGAPSNGGVLMLSQTSGDPGFYAKKRAREAEIGRELTTEEFLVEHYEASDAPTASGTSIFDPVLCEIAYRWFCLQGGTVLDPFAGGSGRGIVASRLGPLCRDRTSARAGRGESPGNHALIYGERPTRCCPMPAISHLRRSIRAVHCSDANARNSACWKLHGKLP